MLGQIRSKKSKLLVFDQSKKPVPGLFSFSDLADCGLASKLDAGRVRVTKINIDSPLRAVLKEGDVILEVTGIRIESIAQFRRLIEQSRQSGRIDLKVERMGQTLRINNPARKFEPKT